MNKFIGYLVFFSCWSSLSFSQSFITRNGNKLTNGPGGPEIYLRGMCIGNRVWENIALPDQAQKEIDYARIQKLGMNTVRFYLNYKTLEDDANPFVYKPEGWAWLDSNLVWAKKNQLYVILNIHVPQGGFQSLCAGGGLWQTMANQDRFVALWKAIADRYKNETQIAGYNLLNEPIPTDSLAQWQHLEQRTTDSVRKVDNNHLIFSEKSIALNCNYGYDNGRGNFNILNESKLVYSIHTYDPYEYTHQLQAWANTGDGGKYPDETILSLPFDAKYVTGNYTNPKLPTGNSNWTFFTGNPFTITDDSLIIGKPVFQGNFLGAGKAYFDEITINEVNANGAIVQQIMTYNFTSTGNVSYWSANSTGGVSLSNNGPNDNSSIVLTGSSNYASATANNLPFKVYKNKRYQINGWMKGENIPANSQAAITTEFYASPSRQKVGARNKEFLRKMLIQYTKFPRDNNYPIYYGEFGLVRNCFDNNKGGENWVTDMMQLFDSLNIHWTYHVYREGGFGLYDGVTGDVDTSTVKLPLQQAFKNYFASLTNIPNAIKNASFQIPNAYPNPFQSSFTIENTETSELKLELFDVLGKSLEKQTVPSYSKGSLGIKERSGVYLVSIEGGKEKKFVRVVKE